MNSIAIREFSGTVELEPTALQERFALIQTCDSIRSVNNSFTENLCAEILRSVQKVLKEVELTRGQIKAPVLALERQIDCKAKDFCSALLPHELRLRRMLWDYAAEKLRLQFEAEHKRMLELERIDREKREQEERIRTEAAKQAAQAKSTVDVVNTSVRAAQQIAAVQLQAKAATLAVPAAVAPVKTDGVSVRKVWKHEVFDCKALYAAMPAAVPLEPKTAVLNSWINNGMHEIPGVRTWEEIEA